MNMNSRIRRYLDRIGFIGEPHDDFDTLCLLVSHHLKTVPYENLDIPRNIPLSLEPDALYEKIVTRGRGGYCFELNGLFTWLLRELGFPVTEYMGRFLRNETTIPMRRHRVMRVTAGGVDYLCDVGVGSMVPRIPLRLEEGFIREHGGNERYKLEREPFYGFVLYEWKAAAEGGEWRRVYSFTEEEQLNIDYIMPSFYCEKHPDSPFATKDIVHIFTDEGRKSVNGREVKIFSPKGVEVIIPSSESEYEELLKKHFGIIL